MAGCDNEKCDDHEQLAIDQATTARTIRTFGTLFGLFLLILIVISTVSYKGLEEHKEASSKMTTETQVKIANISGVVNLTNSNVSHMQESVAELKILVRNANGMAENRILARGDV